MESFGVAGWRRRKKRRWSECLLHSRGGMSSSTEKKGKEERLFKSWNVLFFFFFLHLRLTLSAYRKRKD